MGQPFAVARVNKWLPILIRPHVWWWLFTFVRCNVWACVQEYGGANAYHGR